MTFDSLTFVVFFIAVVALFNLPGLSWSLRKHFLLGASFVFYGAWNPPFLLLLIASATMDWWLALRMADAGKGMRKPWLVASLVANPGRHGGHPPRIALDAWRPQVEASYNWVRAIQAVGGPVVSCALPTSRPRPDENDWFPHAFS